MYKKVKKAVKHLNKALEEISQVGGFMYLFADESGGDSTNLVRLSKNNLSFQIYLPDPKRPGVYKRHKEED